MVILIWQDMLKRETSIYAFDDLPISVYNAMAACHGHMDDGETDSLPFSAVHAYIAEHDDCRIEGPYEGACVVIVCGIL